MRTVASQGAVDSVGAVKATAWVPSSPAKTMKEAYAVSAENPRESLAELARLGARLIIQRAVEHEFDAWLGRARYERRPEYQRGLRNYDSGLRNRVSPARGAERRGGAGGRDSPGA
jgi:hypothetical protein